MKKWSRWMLKALYVAVAAYVLVTLVREVIAEDFYHSMTAAVTLAVFGLPWWVARIFKVKIGEGLKLGLWLVMFCAVMLGEMQNFYGRIHVWDSVLHTISGWMFAGVGLSLILWLNGRDNVKPIVGVMFAVMFSIMISVFWEFAEFSNDRVRLADAQKDRIVTTVSSVKLNPKPENRAIIIRGIGRTVLYDKQGNELWQIEGGYLDIGIIDTMKDMFVNVIGSIAFAMVAFGWMENHKKRHWIEWFLIER